MNDESSPKAAPVNPAVAAGFDIKSRIFPPSDGAIATVASPIVRHHGDCEACRWMASEIGRLHALRAMWVNQSERIGRDGREIAVLAAALERARHEGERLRGEMNRRNLKGAAA